ncbi:ABC transporter ATP-binding protein [Thiothrix fructosivorans]|uniref:ABC transporter ATP-binding protein n=1 Tax=Thiothrix fructosivorans TaxID=111770 RepID=A0A8B0SGS7_9GAMM|nr:ABC transporter ATP-binding protein [Thiothrix fructosivorans]MBO0613238.1 ABC transporter ATP-binding protein [Thiothrix fructosivorans]QTX11323.1 ABC transporter ATP-binding protein [Thiothrix fructosivorans]
MSSEFAIKIDGIGKNYHIYEKPYHRLLQMFRGTKKVYYRDFWAVRDVSVAIKKGETVGIIGRNGSGKSTLLQMICGTLTPSTGHITVNGRIAALLELGAGFNPEFSGRENVYMNAAVLGLSNTDIDTRFAAIAAFADIGDFIEQPVKTYSSGMFVRLAFAVIAHVDADILVIDEALSVGDAVFSQKCMRFLRKFKEHGTLIFVSHDMGSVLNLCERAVWLHAGQLKQMGISKDVAESYLQYTLQETYGNDVQLQELAVGNITEVKDVPIEIEAGAALIDYGSQMSATENMHIANGWKTGAGEILSVRLEPLIPQPTSVLRGGEAVRMVVTAKTHQDLDHPILGFLVRDRLGQDLFGENTLAFTDVNPTPIAAGKVFEGEFVFRLPMLPNGQYIVMASLANGDIVNHVQHHWLHDALILNISSSKVRWGLVGIQFDKVNFKEVV